MMRKSWQGQGRIAAAAINKALAEQKAEEGTG